MGKFILNSRRLEEKRLDRAVGIGLRGDREIRESEGCVFRWRVQDFHECFRALEASARHAPDHPAARMDGSEVLALRVRYLEYAGGLGINHRLQNRGKVEMIEPATEIAAAVRTEVRDGALETAGQPLQVVEGQVPR